VTDESVTGDQKIALMVLLGEHSIGIGPANATLDQLLHLASENVGGSGVFAQFKDVYASLVSHPVVPTDFVPTTAKCTH
jgi:hypothetical protein